MANNHLEEQRNAFLKKMCKETGLSTAQIRKILADERVERFNPNNKATYRATILAAAGMYKRIEKKLSDTPKPEACPIPDCKGHKKDTIMGHWTCTIGGDRHYWVIFVSEATGESLEDVLVSLTDMKGQQEERDKKAREEWLKQMQE